MYLSCQFQHTSFQKSTFLVEFCFMIFVPVHIFFIQLSFSWTVLNVFLTFHRHCSTGFFTSLTASAVSPWTFQSASLSWFLFQWFLSVSFVYFFSHAIYFLIMSDYMLVFSISLTHPFLSTREFLLPYMKEKSLFFMEGLLFYFFSSCFCFYLFCKGQFI